MVVVSTGGLYTLEPRLPAAVSLWQAWQLGVLKQFEAEASGQRERFVREKRSARPISLKVAA